MKRTRLVLLLLIVSFLNMTVTPFTKPFVYASSNNLNPLRSDVNSDGVVNILDISMVASAWDAYPGHPKWNSTFDFNSDYVVNILDLALVAKAYGKSWLSYDFNELIDLNVWQVVSGTWSTLAGLLKGSSNSEGLTYAKDLAWKDCTLNAKVKIAADSPRPEAAFCICLVDSGNYYWAGLGCWGHRVSISRKVNGVAEELIFAGDEADVAKDTWYNLSIKISRDQIALYLNDALELAMTDSALGGGMVGIRSWGSHVLVDYLVVSGYASTPTVYGESEMKKLSVSYGRFTEERAQFAAQHFDVILVDYLYIGGTHTRIKQINPNVHLFNYQDSKGMYKHYPDWSVVSQHPDWFMKDTDGNPLMIRDVWGGPMVSAKQEYFMDIRNSEYQNHFAAKSKWILDTHPEMSGLFLDNCWPEFSDWLRANLFTVPIDKVPKLPNFYADLRTLIGKVKAAIGNKGLLLNIQSSACLDYLTVGGADGGVFESFAHGLDQDYTYWSDYWLPRNCLALRDLATSGKWIFPLTGVKPAGNDAVEKDVGKVGLCLALLSAEDTSKLGFSFARSYADPMVNYFAELDFDFGVPLGSPVQAATNVWKRDFANCSVYVNMGDTPYTFNYQNKDYTVQPKSALILPRAR